MTTPTPKPTLIIGLVGLAGSGKDTVAEILQSSWQHDGHVTARTAFADPIRNSFIGLVRDAGIANPEQWVQPGWKEKSVPVLGISYRHYAQTYGTDYAHKEMGRDVWIRVLDHKLLSYCELQQVTHFVVPDVRFTVESDWLRDQGAVLWRIERPDMQPVREHVSETGAASIRTHRTILNDGTLDDLRRTVSFELAKLRYEQGMLA